MSTSLLYYGFGIRGYQNVNTTYEVGTVIFTAAQDFVKLNCSVCGARPVSSKGQDRRLFRSWPIG